METLSQLLSRTINAGAPLFNEGKKQECLELYLEAATLAVEQDTLSRSKVGDMMKVAIEEGTDLLKKQKYGEGAWVLRRCFDKVHTLEHDRSFLVQTQSFEGSVNSDRDSIWQDEAVGSANDFERGQALADIAYILRGSLEPKQHTRYGNKTHENCFEASEVVEELMRLGLGGKDRKAVTMRCTLLLRAGLLVPVSHKDDIETFHDGTRLYCFPTPEETQAAMDKLQNEDEAHVDGTDKHALVMAVEATLDLDKATTTAPKYAGVSSHHLKAAPRRASSSIRTPDYAKGSQLAALAAVLEEKVNLADRKYLLKTYERCFVGKDAVDLVVSHKISRKDATKKLDEVLGAGLIYHVTREHRFEDAKFFYRISSPKEIRASLDACNESSIATSASAQSTHLIMCSALVNRYNQFASLDVASILNYLYGCKHQSGWDSEDLDNWRTNMKRWGFGCPQDQDDGMVERLAPLALDVDPDTWDVSGDPEWESPWGIIAQIAIFDHVPRSAFRGTEEAFKWDELAIRATKVAIEKGYFETAFKSTFNRFVLLLPLEHSKSWEDQKLGVTLLLQMLSTVAVEDEGLSDYEIAKRLEFSKRLATAFLEHAQAIAKLKRCLYRNRHKGRTITLEERVWLASDLVPRWAQSQNAPSGGKNVIQLPVIPLKKLKRGKFLKMVD
jgi:uncharacterized protein (DUF924 family)